MNIKTTITLINGYIPTTAIEEEELKDVHADLDNAGIKIKNKVRIVSSD